MQYLKEDGSLDYKKINSLPIEEYIKFVENLTQDQYEDFFANQPPEEGKEPFKPVYVDYTLEEDIEKNGAVLADDLINNLRKRRKNKRNSIPDN